jgi:hypothetical protein
MSWATDTPISSGESQRHDEHVPQAGHSAIQRFVAAGWVEIGYRSLTVTNLSKTATSSSQRGHPSRPHYRGPSSSPKSEIDAQEAELDEVLSRFRNDNGYE